MTGYQNYARTDIQTSDPRAVVVLLYEGSIKFLGQAKDALNKGERQEMSVYLQKTQKIIHFLSNALDFELGGEIAANLDRLYAYTRDILNEANYKAEPARIDEALQLLKPLLEAWREIARDPAAAAALEQRSAMFGRMRPLNPAGEEPGPSDQNPNAPDTAVHSNAAENRRAATDQVPAQESGPRVDKKVAGRAAYGISKSI
jgi:flagellar protein FliS